MAIIALFVPRILFDGTFAFAGTAKMSQHVMPDEISRAGIRAFPI